MGSKPTLWPRDRVYVYIPTATPVSKTYEEGGGKGFLRAFQVRPRRRTEAEPAAGRNLDRRLQLRVERPGRHLQRNRLGLVAMPGVANGRIYVGTRDGHVLGFGAR